MDLQTETDINGIIHLPITSKHLDEWLLWRINTGVLNKDGYRLVYDKMPDGSVKLKLLISPSKDVKFQYSEAAYSKALSAWNEFEALIR